MLRSRSIKVPDLLALLALAALLALLAVALTDCAALPGSDSERRQLRAIDAIEKGNNAVRTYLAPTIPSPYREMVEGAGVAVAGGLAFWLKRVHGKVDKLSANNHAPQKPLTTA